MLLASNAPGDHPRISKVERMYIESGVGQRLVSIFSNLL